MLGTALFNRSLEESGAISSTVRLLRLYFFLFFFFKQTVCNESFAH